MSKFTILLTVFAVSLFSARGASDANSQIGVVDTNQTNQICLAIQNASLKTGDKVFIVSPEKPQTAKMAVIEKKLTSSCSRNTETNEDDSFYLLKLSKGKTDSPFIAFGVISPDSIIPVKGVVSLDLNSDKKREYFRACYSNEGLHLTVWTGKPLVGKRIWHSYYSLGYDVEPNCKKADYKE